MDARTILDAEGYHDWSVVETHSGGGLCCHGVKELWLDAEHINSLPWLLHEVAHIKYPDHTSLWGDHYTALLDKWMEYRNLIPGPGAGNSRPISGQWP